MKIKTNCTAIDNTVVTIEQVNTLISINADLIHDIQTAGDSVRDSKDSNERKMAIGMLLNELDNKLNKLNTTNDIISKMLKHRENELNDCSMHHDTDVKGGAEHD